MKNKQLIFLLPAVIYVFVLIWFILFSIYSVADAEELSLPLKKYKDNYIIHSQGETDGEIENNLRFQFSFYTDVLGPLAFSYTQRSIWRLWEPSSPITDADYNPSLFVRFSDVEMGYEHESNGMAGRSSRSWERLFVSYMHKTEFVNIGYKHWQPFFLHENQEIVEYQGKGELLLEFRLSDKLSAKAVAREHSTTSMLNFKLTRNVAVSVLVFNGYGMNIIEFDKVANWYGVGVSL